ncbi:MAG: penicillin-binding protein 2 [Anaerolineae bacterium]|jgi:penicillin-binding protein 2|nr:penicillin-binding protein 2 [Anaerolineae bacterium]MBT4310542.1 penicillin-binding protein 2 [Anaerolineae bacterium]MBT4457411.1 penicillin-binding protein 2 [Anaerolineae bacterium]MBT6060473.1 penicillin-binding protein 2 [Anaerolineae bacterium]MBT6323244.1 penicillin-binding protein 2 [Anaerolineae bacterium]
MSSSSRAGFRAEPWRVLVFYFAAVLVFMLLAFKLFSLQIFEGENWLVRAEDNFTREISIPTSRGIIYDRNGVILARNIAAYNVVITPANLPDDLADIQHIYRELSEIVDVPVSSGTLEEAKLFAACVPGPGITQLVELGDSLAPYRSVPVSCDVSEEIARIVRERAVGWPGVSVQIDPIRDYPTGSLTANIIGFLGPIPATQVDFYEELGFIAGRDKIGYAGVESTLQDILAGTNGKRVVEVDVAGKELRNLEPPIQAVVGRNVRLSLDLRLQKAAEGALLNEITGWNAYFGQIRISSGVTIAMNPKTGEILAMVSYPSYENNRLARFIPAYYYQQLSEDPRHPLLNNAISSEYPPGSVFKLSTATGALNEGVVTVNQTIYAPGQLILTEKFSPNDPGRERPFVDWIYDEKPDGFGEINFLRCIAYSSNVCFYKLGGGYEDEIPEGLGVLRLREYARALGYDEPSGIELPGEADGLIPSPQWKRINQGENWSTGDTYIASVGQGYVLSTPLQVLMSGATIANDGKLMQPTIVREEIDDEGRLLSPFVPRLKWDITETPLITNFDCDDGYCLDMETKSAVDPFVVEQVQNGMRLAVTNTLYGTLNDVFGDFPIAVAGKTGTAEYCDDVALAANRCTFGNWPTHSWTLAYAPFDDPEIIIMAFMYNGGEGAAVAGPVVQRVMEAYFELKAIDLAEGGGG